MKRRDFLARAGAAGFGAAVGGLHQLVAAKTASAAPGDYKALVCIFLLGGLDNHDTVLPLDAASYDEYARIRRDLMGAYTTQRTRQALLPLATPSEQFGDRQFALPPEMPNLKGLYDQNRLAVIGNVGPLLEPVTRASFENQTVNLPSRLFSHNDQQSTWMAGSPEGAQFGWAGLFADAMLSQNGAPEFSAVTSGGNDLFITGRSAVPYQISTEGASRIFRFEELEDGPAKDRLREHLRASAGTARGLLERDLSDAARRSFDANARFNQASESAAGLTTAFPPSYLGLQLQAVARGIAARDALSVCRQVFVVGMGGYDTHSAQATSLPGLQTDLDLSIAAFQQAMDQLGVSDQVTLFTASDFGRTLAVNGDGTDHGWGGHQLVVGGAVDGGKIFGSLPEVGFGHELDAGSGRLIPTTSVEQFAEPLGRWFGLGASELSTALPRLSAFSDPGPSFMRT